MKRKHLNLLIHYYYSEFKVAYISIEWSVSVLLWFGMVWFDVMWCGPWHGQCHFINCCQTGASLYVYCIAVWSNCGWKESKTVLWKRQDRMRKKRSQIAKWIQLTESAYVVKIESEIGSPIGIYHCTKQYLFIFLQYNYYCTLYIQTHAV